MHFGKTDCEGEASSVALYLLYLYFSIDNGQLV
jgi:hypothetical protein